MANPRKRAVIWSALALLGIWMLALGGYWIADNLKVTADKVRAYMESVDLSKLSAEQRAKALAKLADKINKLSREERQRLRLGRAMTDWFAQMTEEEKGAFIEATMPTGFKQMLSAFEEMPEEKRQRAVNDAMKRLREDRERLATDGGGRGAGQGQSSTNRPPPLSPELEAKVREIGLKAFYSESSAQTKAELAPVLEELQKTMESGRFQRRGL